MAKRKQAKEPALDEKKSANGTGKVKKVAEIPEKTDVQKIFGIIWNVIGILVGLGIGKHHAWYQYIQHENEMWFSNIKEVEREISFRTESGLYYSYFKQTIQGKIQQKKF